jgi:hypothetical protein
MAGKFTVEFDTSDNITRVVAVNGKETLFREFTPLSENPITNLQAVTITQVFVAPTAVTSIRMVAW